MNSHLLDAKNNTSRHHIRKLKTKNAFFLFGKLNTAHTKSGMDEASACCEFVYEDALIQKYGNSFVWTVFRKSDLVDRIAVCWSNDRRKCENVHLNDLLKFERWIWWDHLSVANIYRESPSLVYISVHKLLLEWKNCYFSANKLLSWEFKTEIVASIEFRIHFSPRSAIKNHFKPLKRTDNFCHRKCSKNIWCFNDLF